MNRGTMILAGLLAALFGANAASADADGSSWYVEGGYHYGQIDTFEPINVGMSGANLGYQFKNGWGVEATIIQGLTGEKLNPGYYSGPGYEFGVGTWYGTAVKYNHQLNKDISAFVKLRALMVEVESSTNWYGSGSKPEVKGGWSVGGTYKISDKAYAILELGQQIDIYLGAFVGVGLKF